MMALCAARDYFTNITSDRAANKCSGLKLTLSTTRENILQKENCLAYQDILVHHILDLGYPSDDCKLHNLLNNGIAGTFFNQWGRRLDGWTNTVTRLAGWRRVTRQVWFCTRWTGCIQPAFSIPYRLPDRSCPATGWWNYQLLLYRECTQPSVMSWWNYQLLLYSECIRHRHELRLARKAWPDILVDPCLLSGYICHVPFISRFMLQLSWILEGLCYR